MVKGYKNKDGCNQGNDVSDVAPNLQGCIREAQKVKKLRSQNFTKNDKDQGEDNRNSKLECEI